MPRTSKTSRVLDPPIELREEAACLPLERLEAEITLLAGNLAAAECRWLLLVAEFDRRRGWQQWGCRSLVHWLGWHCALDERAARENVRVARALTEFGVIRNKFAQGRLSYSKVRAITRIATPETEAARSRQPLSAASANGPGQRARPSECDAPPRSATSSSLPSGRPPCQWTQRTGTS
jgi:hypothetical protein